MKRLLPATAIGLVLALSSSCMEQASLTKAPITTEASLTASKVDNFRLVDEAGRAHELYRLKNAKAVVLVMQGVGCPIVRKMSPDLEKVRAEYAAKGVEFLMINSNIQDTRDTIATEAAEFGVKMPILKDEQQFVGMQLGAVRTAEVFVIDPKTWKVAYHGPLNDRLTYGREKAKAEKNYAADAINAIMAGKTPKVTKAEADGCLINFPDRSLEAQASFKKISYSTAIAPMIEEKCVACHQEGSIAPFAFDSYEKVKGFAPMIREAVRTDRMPPWDADAHIGAFKDDKSLSSEQMKMLVNWVEAGAPRGEGADPLTATKRVAPEWPLGKPDAIVEIPKYTVPASGIVDYQYPVVASPLTEGKWLKAATAKVSQRQAVHHILSGHIPEGQSTKGGMTSWGGGVGGYTVGMESVVAPKGIGSYIPAGGSFGYQLHYTPFGKEAVAADKIGLYFYKDGEKPDLIMRESPLVDQFIKIPAFDGNHKEIAYFNFPKDAILHTAVVHAHYRGTYSKLEIRYPNGKQKTILNVPFYDFNWQRMYEFAEPIAVPAGSKVIATYIYDNSASNPANPDPSKEIVWGDQSFEEMFYTSLRYRWVDETAEKQTNYDELMLKTRLIGMLDDNLNDRVEVSELRGPFAALADKFPLADSNKDGGIDAKEFEPVMKMMNAGRRGAPKPAAE